MPHKTQPILHSRWHSSPLVVPCKPFYSGHSVPKDTVIILWWTAFKVQGVLCVFVCVCVRVCVCVFVLCVVCVVCVCMVHSAQILSRIHNVPTCTLNDWSSHVHFLPHTHIHTYILSHGIDSCNCSSFSQHISYLLLQTRTNWFITCVYTQLGVYSCNLYIIHNRIYKIMCV